MQLSASSNVNENENELSTHTSPFEYRIDSDKKLSDQLPEA
jgi:hypothetical protein